MFLYHLAFITSYTYKLILIIYTLHTFGKGNGNPLQYSCLENSMDVGDWWATVHGVAEHWTQLSNRAHMQGR